MIGLGPNDGSQISRRTDLQDIHDVCFNADRGVGVLVGGLQPLVVKGQAKPRNAFLAFGVIGDAWRGLEGSGERGEDQEEPEDAVSRNKDVHIEKIDLEQKRFWQLLGKQMSFYHISTISLFWLLSLSFRSPNSHSFILSFSTPFRPSKNSCFWVELFFLGRCVFGPKWLFKCHHRRRFVRHLLQIFSSIASVANVYIVLGTPGR